MLLLSLRVESRRREWAKVGAWNCKVWYLKACIVRGYCRGNQWGEALYWVSLNSSQPCSVQTYSVVLAHVISLVEEGLLGVQLLKITVRVAMHLNTVGCRRDSLVRLVQLLLRLGEGRGVGLAVLPHAVVEEAIGVVAGILGDLWGEMALELVDVEGVGQIGQLLVV